MTGQGADVTGARTRHEPGEAPSAAVAAKAADENFPVALRLLPSRRRRYLMAVYVFARTVDDIGDRAPVADRLGLLAEMEADLRRLYGTAEPPRLAPVRDLRQAVAHCGIPMRPFLDLIDANRQDQVVSRYPTINELFDYCRLSANPVGRIVLYVFNAFTTSNAELSDSVCTGLQLAEHWQDVAEDFHDGRIYLPGEDMDRFGCEESQLGEPHAPAELRRLLEFEVNRAGALLEQGAPLVGELGGTARLAVAGYLAGGRAALAAIRKARYDVLAGAPRPGKARTAAELILAFARGR